MDVLKLPVWLASRPRRADVTTVVLHATAGGSLAGALSALRQRELSYHYLIAKDGTITKAVAYTREAYHAGKSFGPGGQHVNRYSIGVAFVNRNDGIDAYTPAQLLSAEGLLVDLRRSIPTLRWLTCHYSISPGRKSDPRGFPALALAHTTRLEGWKVKR